jgi:uncharacterized protein (UPF0147 family)
MSKKTINRSDILRLAAEAQLDPRTVKRALEKGIDRMQTEVDKSRIRAAAAKLKIKIEERHRRTKSGSDDNGAP